MLILAGVSLNIVLGDQGIVKKAKDTNIKNEIAKVQEALELKITDMQMGNMEISNPSAGMISGLTKEIMVENGEKDIYLIVDLSKIDTSSNLGKGNIPEGDTISSLNDLKDIYIIDQSNQVHYIDGNGEKYGNLEVDGLKKIVGSSSDWVVEGNKVVQYLGVLDEETNIVIPNYVGNTKITTVGSEIFNGAQAKGTLTISEGIETIEDSAFKESAFTGNLVIPDSVVSIGEWAFSNCSGFTGNLVIPDSVVSIGEWAFSDCSGFTGTLTIGNSVETIGQTAFIHCSGIASVNVPNSVTSIGGGAFADMPQCTSIIIDNTSTYFSNSNNWGCNPSIIQYLR